MNFIVETYPFSNNIHDHLSNAYNIINLTRNTSYDFDIPLSIFLLCTLCNHYMGLTERAQEIGKIKRKENFGEYF